MSLRSRTGSSGVPRPCVVLAEDHPALAAELRRLLESEYDVVDIVQDGGALIEVAGLVLPDAIVCDITMAGVGGLAAADAILASRPDSRIVFVTGNDDGAVIRRALAGGAFGYVLKCDAGADLVAAVRAAIQGHQYLSSNARLALYRGSP